MKPVAIAVVRSGLVNNDVMTELRRWGFPVELVQEDKILKNPRQIVDLIQNALESADQVKISETDLDVLSRYIDPRYRREGTLVAKDGDQKAVSKVTFCVTTLGEYAIPWVSESIFELMTNGETYLRFKNIEGENERIKFIDVREVFFGEQKAFMVCMGGG